MDLTPLISIIIPVYNVEKFLGNCLNSVSAQTYPHWEAICINDGSTDNSLEILKKYAAKDPRFQIIDQKNQGLAGARNSGLPRARGKYLMFLDSDDFWHPQTLELLVNAMEESDADLGCFNYRKVYPDEQIVFPPYASAPAFRSCTAPLVSFLRRKIKTGVLVWNKIYRTELAQSIAFLPIHPGEDDIYTFEIMLRAGKVILLNDVFSYYMQNPDSIMHKTDAAKMRKNRLEIEKQLIRIVKEFCRQSSDDLKKRACRKYLSERIVFREHILNPLRQNQCKDKIKFETRLLQQMQNDGIFNPELMNPRLRAIWKLLSNGYYLPALILAKI